MGALGVLSLFSSWHARPSSLVTMTALTVPAVAVPKLPSVSVQLVTYERPHFMLAALQQIAKQDYSGDMEVVVVDDSSASSEAAVMDLADQIGLKVRYLFLPQRTPIGSKRNLAIESSDAEVLCVWDDDDLFTSDRITQQVARLEASTADDEQRGCTSIGIRYRYSLDKQLLNILPATGLPAMPFENTLCFRRSWLEAGASRRFADQGRGEMSQLFHSGPFGYAEEAGSVPSEELPFIYVRHKSAVCGDGVVAEDDPIYKMFVTREPTPLVCPVFLSLARALRQGRFPELPDCGEYDSVLQNIFGLVADRIGADMDRLRCENPAHSKEYHKLLTGQACGEEEARLDEMLALIDEVHNSFRVRGSGGK